MGTNLLNENLRSIDYTHSVRVKFCNTTNRSVDVIWVDSEGQWIRYEILTPGDVFETDTYVTHPWVFLDEKTKIALLAAGRGNIFRPLLTDIKEDEKCHVEISITDPLVALKDRCLEVLCKGVCNREAFNQLHLCRRIVLQLMEFYDIQLRYEIVDLASVVATCQEETPIE